MRIAAALVLALLLSQNARAAEAIHWQPWSTQVFAQAKAEHRFVLLDLEAVWCHWCHVMDEQTYADPAVIALMGKRYIAVKVDQDSDPALSDRYGDWGWPATIVFAADGSEIVKRQGFMPPANMASLLQAIIDDPSPGPSVRPEATVQAAATGALPAGARQALLAGYIQGYDAKYGGWGDLDKYIDGYAMEYAFGAAADPAYVHMAQQTLDSAQALIDPVWGGVDQYSVSADWKTPHYEKIVSIQADYLRVYSEAYLRWHRPADLAAARAIHGYLDAFLKSPAGGFYVSQDADLSAQVDGGGYYKLDDAARRKLGVPRVDTHVYARENGWVVRALCAYHAATGDGSALTEAAAAARQMQSQQALPGGGYSHGGAKAGPYLGDSLAMADGYLALYGTSGDRAWLQPALQALDFIQGHFADARRGGYMTVPVNPGAMGVFKESVRLPEENADLARVAGLAYAYSGDVRYQRMQRQAMAYLASPGLTDSGRFLPSVLLADAMARSGPLHITVVGHKDDAAAQALHAAALAYPAAYKQLDWWDKREGALPNAEVTYPELARPAAFVCTGSTCSSPIFDPAQLAATVDRLSAVK